MRLVVIHWEDSHSGRGWRKLDEISEDCAPLKCRSVGWLIAERNGLVTIASSLSGEGQGLVVCGSGDISIPRKSIRKMVTLKDSRLG